MHTALYNPYIDQSCFDREMRKIFSSMWVYGCTWPEIEPEGSFVVVNAAFGEVIITTNSGQPKAFFNKCLHRGHRLTDVSHGQTSSFVCPYHGWQYDRSGKLENIPGAVKFYGKEAVNFQKKKSVQNVNVIRLGDLIFINASVDPHAIDEQFSPTVIDGIELTRDKLGSDMIMMSVELPFNWKLIFENLRDGLHPTFLHKTSLTKEVHFSFTNTFKEDDLRDDIELLDLSSFSRDGETNTPNAPHKSQFELIDNKNHYLNWLLFPYTHIASPDGGALIGIENYVPVAPTSTRFELKLHITKTLGHASPIPILKRWLDKAQVVFKEDFDAVISVQKNVTSSGMTQNLGAYEAFNASVHKWFETNIYG